MFNAYDRQLFLGWLLRCPSGSYAPKLADVLEKDKCGAFKTMQDVVEAIDKDSSSMLLFVQFVIEERRMFWAVAIEGSLRAGRISTVLSANERLGLQIW